MTENRPEIFCRGGRVVRVTINGYIGTFGSDTKFYILDCYSHYTAVCSGQKFIEVYCFKMYQGFISVRYSHTCRCRYRNNYNEGRCLNSNFSRKNKHTIPYMPMWGRTTVGQESWGKHGKGLYCGFHWKERARQVKKTKQV